MMDLFEMGRAILRRRVVAIAILLGTIGAAVLAHTLTPPIYEAKGSVVLEPPTASAGAEISDSIDLVTFADRLRTESGGDLPPFSLSLQGPMDYRLAVVGNQATARDDTTAILDRLDEMVQAVQEEGSIPDLERIRVVETDRRVASAPAVDGSVVVRAGVGLRDPSESVANPFSAGDATGQRISVAVSADAAQERFLDEVGPGADFTVGQEPGDPIALLNVSTTSSDPGQAVDAFDVVASLLVDELRREQANAGVLPGQQVRLSVVEQPRQADYRSPPVKRPSVVVLVLGSLAVPIVPISLESRRRRRADAVPQSEPGVGASRSGAGIHPAPDLRGRKVHS